MKDWSEYLEGFTIEGDNLDPLMDKCREYIAALEGDEIYEFHADFAPFYEGIKAREMQLEAQHGENWCQCMPKKAVMEFLMVSTPIKCLAAAVNERLLGESPA